MKILPLKRKPLFITLLYLVLGVAWILFGDELARILVGHDTSELIVFQRIKGLTYVVLTALLLYYLTRNLFLEVSKGKDELDLLFSNPNLGILKLNRQGNFVYLSQNVRHLLGYRPEELIGINLRNLSPAQPGSGEIGISKKILAGKLNSFSYEKVLLSKSGNPVHFLFNGQVLRNEKGRITGFIAAFQNITERSRHIEAIENQNKKLSEIAWLQSHVLRAPLARILGLLNLMDIDYPMVRKNAPEIIDGLHISARELDQIIHRITDQTQSIDLENNRSYLTTHSVRKHKSAS